MGEDDGLVGVCATFPLGIVALARTFNQHWVDDARLCFCEIDPARDAVLQRNDFVQATVLDVVRNVVAHLPCLGVLAR